MLNLHYAVEIKNARCGENVFHGMLLCLTSCISRSLIHTEGDTYGINSMYIVVYSSGYLAVLLCRVSFFRYLCAPILEKDVALQDNSK